MPNTYLNNLILLEIEVTPLENLSTSPEPVLTQASIYEVVRF